jgi:hypothetical protein
MDAFDTIIDEIAAAETLTRGKAIPEPKPSVAAPSPQISPAKGRGKATWNPQTMSSAPSPQIAEPERAERSRAVIPPLPNTDAPGSPLSAGEIPSMTRAKISQQPNKRAPASKLSSKEAGQANTPSQHCYAAPVPKIPAKAGRQSNGMLIPMALSTDAAIPVNPGANEASDEMQPVALAPRSHKSRRKVGEIGQTMRDTRFPVANLDSSARESGDAGQCHSDSHQVAASIENSPQGDGGGHVKPDPHAKCAPAATLAERPDDDGQIPNETHTTDAYVIDQIRQLWRMRQQWHRAEKALVLQAKAICRSWTNGDKVEAGKLFDAVEDNKSAPVEVIIALMPFLTSINGFHPERVKIEKQLQKLAKSFPVWPWVAAQKGFGALNFAAIVGEAGDVGSYRNPSCLWKRMGLAVIEGERQRRVADAEKALLHGYNPARRSVAYLLGDCLLRGNQDGSNAGGNAAPHKYKLVYLEKKDKEIEKLGITSKAHVHNRAARYMTKRVLRDLWIEWKRANDPSFVSVEFSATSA